MSSTSVLSLKQLYIIRASVAGPTVVITAGIHGTEIAGVKAAEQLSRIRIQRGRVIIYPLVNRIAYQKRIRGNPDLNRTFPVRLNGAPKHRVARTLFQSVKSYKPTWCIDLHEADGLYRVNRTRLGQTLIVYPNQETRRVATQAVQIVNTQIQNSKYQFSVIHRILPGSFRTAVATVLKCHAVTVETCMQMPLQKRIDAQVRIVKALLGSLKMY